MEAVKPQSVKPKPVEQDMSPAGKSQKVENKQNGKTAKPRQPKMYTKGDHRFQIKHKLDAMIHQAVGVPERALEALGNARAIIWDVIKEREEDPMQKIL